MIECDVASALERESNEVEYTVILTTPFEMFATEVTNQQFVDLAQWAYIKVAHGGYWNNYAHFCRSAYRSYDYPYSSGNYSRFRPVRSVN